METKGLNLKSSQTTEKPVTAHPEALSALWQAIHSDSSGAYFSLREDLNRAVNEYALSHYMQAATSLRTLITYLNTEVDRSEPNTKAAGQLTALRAAAHSVLGRVYERLDQKEQAVESFRFSVQMYDDVQKKGYDEEVSPQDYRDLGIALFKVGRLKEASYIFKTALEHGDQSPETNSYIGRILHQNRDFQNAQSYLRKAAELNPDDAATTIALAENLQAQGDTFEAIQSYMKAALAAAKHNQWDEALDLIEQCNQLNPGNIKVLSVKAEVLRHMERYDDALVAIDDILKIEPQDAVALCLKGEVLRELKQYEAAAEILERAIDSDPNLGSTYAALGETLRLMGEHERALSVFDRALELDPYNVLAREGIGASLTAIERYDEAVKVLDQLLNEDPENAFAWAYKGEALRMTDKYDEALISLDKSLEIEPDDAFALGTKGQVLRMLNRNEEAIMALERAISEDASLAWAHAELGEALRLLGRNDEALTMLDRALALEPDNPLTLGSKGAVLYTLRRYEDALEALNESLGLQPHYAWAYSLKGSILCDLGAFEEAAQALSHVNQDNPSHLLSYSLRLKGWAWENLGIESPEKAMEAKEAYEAALEVDPDDLWSLKGIANSLYMIDKRKEAKLSYKEILARLSDKDNVDARTVALRGWCHYRVGEYDDAMRRFVDALSLDPNIMFAQFDLALVSLDSERYALGAHEYERALHHLQEEYPRRRRGLLHVALKDLRIAMRFSSHLRKAAEAQYALKEMEKEFEKANMAGPLKRSHNSVYTASPAGAE